MDDFFASSYYGLDWIGMVLTLSSLYIVGNKSRWGFIGFMSANCCWFSIGFLIDSHPMMINTACVFMMNIRNFIKWAPEQEKEQAQ